MLLAGGFYAYSSRNAPAAPAASQVTALLDASVNPSHVTVGLTTVSKRHRSMAPHLYRTDSPRPRHNLDVNG